MWKAISLLGALGLFGFAACSSSATSDDSTTDDGGAGADSDSGSLADATVNDTTMNDTTTNGGDAAGKTDGSAVDGGVDDAGSSDGGANDASADDGGLIDAGSEAGPLGVIVVSPRLVPIPITFYEKFTAVRVYDGGVTDISASVTWSTSPAGFATISNAAADRGTATGTALGNIMVIATDPANGQTGSVATMVNNATLTNLLVSPNAGKVAVGNTLQMTCSGSFSDNISRDVTRHVTWSSSDTSILTIDPATGLATGVKIGTVAVEAMDPTTVPDSVAVDVQ